MSGSDIERGLDCVPLVGVACQAGDPARPVNKVADVGDDALVALGEVVKILIGDRSACGPYDVTVIPGDGSRLHVVGRHRLLHKISRGRRQITDVPITRIRLSDQAPAGLGYLRPGKTVDYLYRLLFQTGSHARTQS